MQSIQSESFFLVASVTQLSCMRKATDSRSLLLIKVLIFVGLSHKIRTDAVKKELVVMRES